MDIISDRRFSGLWNINSGHFIGHSLAHQWCLRSLIFKVFGFRHNARVRINEDYKFTIAHWTPSQSTQWEVGWMVGWQWGSNRNEETFRMASGVEVMNITKTRDKRTGIPESIKKKRKNIEKRSAKTRYLVSLRTSQSSRLLRKKEKQKGFLLMILFILTPSSL